MKKAGFGLVEVLVALALLSVLSLGLARFATFSSKQQSRTVTINKLEEVRAIFYTTLRNNDAWVSTINDPSNPGMACLKNSTSCTGLPTAATAKFRANDPSGNPILGYSPLASASNGFTLNGTVCNTYVPPPGVGNDNCPFRLDLTWNPVCPAVGPCTNPLVMVDGVFTYNPGSPAAGPDRQLAFNGATTGHGFRVATAGVTAPGGPQGTLHCNVVTSVLQSGGAYNTTVVAACPAGTALTGGGCDMSSYTGGYGTGGAAFHRAHPLGNSFVCSRAWGAGAGQNPVAYAICCG